MIIQRLPVGELTRQTGVAMDRLGREGGRAIKGNQKLIPQNPETVAPVVLCQALKDLEQDGVEMARGNRIEAGADLVVTGNLLDAKQGLGVMASLAGLESALVRQKRWRWREEEAKGASGGVLHRVTGIGAGFARVREVSAALVQDRFEIIEASGVRHRCLLGAWEISTLAKSVLIDNLEPLLKSKLELLPPYSL